MPTPPLSRLRLQNWRSLREVEIDFTPITVFIGANSSGKTNILDALSFLRECQTDGVVQAVQNRGGAEDIWTMAPSPLHEPLEIEISLVTRQDHRPLQYRLTLDYPTAATGIPTTHEALDTADGPPLLVLNTERHALGHGSQDNDLSVLLSPPNAWNTGLSLYANQPSYPRHYEAATFLIERLQLLAEHFHPPLTVYGQLTGNLKLISPLATNTLTMLHFMAYAVPDTYAGLQADLMDIVGHIEAAELKRSEGMTHFSIREMQRSRPAPTVSAGTARIVAMLAAYHALDMPPFAALPGLVVIEEPDTALNPWLLQRLVDTLRAYTSREDAPRQFILTTHNPAFLNHFAPDEVRIVERDEQGYSTVRHIPDHVRRIWQLDDKAGEFGVGDVWTSGSLGGVPR